MKLTSSLRVVRSAFAVLSFSTALAITACGGGNSDSTTGPGAQDGSVRIRNDASVSVYYAYIKSCGTTEWGADRLGTETVVPGNSATLSIASGCYDVRLRSSIALNKTMEKTGVIVGGGQIAEVRVTDW